MFLKPTDIPPPHPTIYLRDKFSIKPGLTGQFFEGQKELLKHARPDLTLVAACGTRPLIVDAAVPEKLPRMMHIWKVEEWDTLYKLMYTFSETDWYSSEVRSLKIECQDLLIGTGHGIALDERPKAWIDDTKPGYVYLYDEIRLLPSVTKLRYLMDLNWFRAQVKGRMDLVWLASEITGTPSQVCLLWKACDEATIEHTMREMTYQEPYAKRFAQMMLAVASLSREYMYPESTERF